MVKTKRRPRCRWCNKHLDSQSHPDSEPLCFRVNEKKIRSRMRPRVKTLSETYLDGHLRSEFISTDMEDKLMDRQRRLALDAILGLSDNGYKVPRNVHYFMDYGFIWNQIADQKPWAVYVLVPGEDGPRRKRKRCNNLWEAVLFHRKTIEEYPNSGIVSLARAYDIPREWALKKDKLPKRFKWCPHCCTFRVFRRVNPPQQFFAMVKRPVTDEKKIAKGVLFEWIERKLWLTECQLCGHTNRSQIFRRSNQQWEVRRIRQGKHRVKPHIRSQQKKVKR